MAARPPNLGQPLEECVDEAQAGYQRREPERRIDESELRDSLAQGGSLGRSEETRGFPAGCRVPMPRASTPAPPGLESGLCAIRSVSESLPSRLE